MTPKPRPSIILPAAPTAFTVYTLRPVKPAKPTSPTLSSLVPQSNRHTGPEVLPETPWPIHGNYLFIYLYYKAKSFCHFILFWSFSSTVSAAAGQIDFEQPTPEPSGSRLLEAGGAGMKPRITVLNSASVSVLAEGDVFLPCKAAGNPKPNISWTKVSTGKIRVNETLWTRQKYSYF